MSNPKRQHYVPQFYLRYFSTRSEEDKYFTNLLFTNTGETRLSVSTKDICVQEHLYSPNVSGKRDYTLEKELGDLEGSFQEIWRILKDHNVDLTTGIFRMGLSLFIANILARSPKSFETQKNLHQRIVELLAQAPKDELGRPLVNRADIGGRTIEIDIDSWKYYVEADHEIEKLEFGKTIRNTTAEISKILRLKRWEIKVTVDDCFITTDSPVVMVNKDKGKFGINAPGTSVFFPITPRKLLIIHDRSDVEQNTYKLVDQDIADQLNFIMMSGANIFGITNLDPVAIDRKIEKMFTRNHLTIASSRFAPQGCSRLKQMLALLRECDKTH